ncbi:uncharacterized protein DEA37_0006766 [Paragonimus westermani]|uniref:Integrase catalytic domain-containing protein n=1 Tax=Paragonimus westermani TaxID=34504 RepID=A0A5J4N6R6_9TREM|nr:uncharacterized protein DEA37_0006766 [Paragonimus westermani]
MPNQEASSTASLSVNEWVARFGTPIELHSDQGLRLKVASWKDCRTLRIHRTRTTPYHSQSNGLVERTNCTVMTILRIFSERHQSDRWVEILPQCLLAYRAVVHSSTGYTDSLLTLGNELRPTIQVLTLLAPPECIGLPHCVKKLDERLRE